MDQEKLYDFIFKRKSVRNYIAEPLDGKTLSDIMSFVGDIKPMVSGIRTETRLLDNKAVKGLFKTNASHFLAFFSEPRTGYLVNSGFMLQQLDLYLSAEGIGSCYQGMAKTVKGIETPVGMELAIMISFGRPKEDVHRKRVSEFKRKPMAKISTVQGMDDILETARLAPSGMNNQPWFFTGGGDIVHAHCAKSLIGTRMNSINIGIALYHIWLAASHHGKAAEFVKDQAGAGNIPKGHQYVISVKIR
ncbi:MAG: hypothetical protein MIO87_02890 [Methanomassiliicoccales archaeon]|nr:hypothetical protein [Methanomassiliicoccales archaeon]